MQKVRRYYLDFKLQFGNQDDLLKVINVGKRLIPRLKNLIAHRLANTKLAGVAKDGMLNFVQHNRVRLGTSRMVDIYNNWAASRSDAKGRSTFFIYHKFFDNDKEYTYTTQTTNNTFTTKGTQIINFLAYGRRGAYKIPKTMPSSTDPVRLVWGYGRRGPMIVRNIPPNKQVYVRRRKRWDDGLFDFVNRSIRLFVDSVREEIAGIIKSESGR